MRALMETGSDPKSQALGDLLNALIGGLGANGLEPESSTVDETGFTVMIHGRLIRIRFEDAGHYLDDPALHEWQEVA